MDHLSILGFYFFVLSRRLTPTEQPQLYSRIVEMADEGFSHPSRMGLVDRIAAHVPYVTSTAWACLWLGDINTLEGIAIDLERNTSFFVTETLRWQFTTVSTKQEDKNLILPLTCQWLIGYMLSFFFCLSLTARSTGQQKGLFKSPPVRRRLDRSLLISSSESKRSSRSDEAKEAVCGSIAITLPLVRWGNH